MYIYHYTFLARIKSVLISSGNYIFKLQWLYLYTFIRRGIIVCWLSPYENNIRLITIYNNLLAELKNRLKISIFLWRKSCASR